MNCIRRGASALALTFAILVGVGGVALAQQTTGRVTGRVTDKDTGQGIVGVTVIVQGPQGEDATLTTTRGEYSFTNLPVGTYTFRFYIANTPVQVEQSGVVVAADSTVRVNAKIAGAAQAASQQLYVINGRAPSVDVGSARVGATFSSDFILNGPNGATYGEILQKAPGAFIDPSGNVSIGGATGLENIYVVNGMNVTGLEFGNLENGAFSIGGGTNLPNEFLTQIEVNAGGYSAEFGGAMGGVINTVLKQGTNEWHGSVFANWSPYFLSLEPNIVTKIGNSIASQRKPDYATNLGVEVGGPLIKDKLFIWIGFAPSLQKDHVFRLTYAQQDANGDGVADTDPRTGYPVTSELKDWRARLNETRQIWNYAGTLDFAPAPEHHLLLTVFGTPSFNQGLRQFNNIDASNAAPSWSEEALTKTNTDASLRWVSQLFNRRWQIEAMLGYHNEYYNQRSPSAALNATNQLEYWGANLSDLEGAPGCEPGAVNPATGQKFQPCPVDNYHRGGYGLTKQYSGQRWSGDIKSLNIIDWAGHHELKYGGQLEDSVFSMDRYYSGPLGSRGLVQLYPSANPQNFNTYTFFTLGRTEFPTDYGPDGMHPYSNLLSPPNYQDHLKADVHSISNAFFLQESYSPPMLRNLTLNLGFRTEYQKLFDTYGVSFLDARNDSPRLSAIYDPFNDGRSKVSVSYGRYYEAIPMNLPARYFGGEGILVRNGVPTGTCMVPNPYDWTGAGEWRNCQIPAKDSTMDAATGGTSPFNNGKDYPVQSHLQGQFHSEVVATVEREIIEDLTVRLDYIHRWLGNIIEDGTTDPNSFLFVLANPGNVPDQSIKDAQADIDARQKDLDNLNAMTAPDPAAVARAQSALTDAKAKKTVLLGLKEAPKPERTYDAITLSVNKRFYRNWFLRAAYTYSRTIGNYEGLYQAELNYCAPNGNNAYDTSDLYLNSKGPLPNDRPHLGRIDGYYTLQVGRGQITTGLSFMVQSGMPRNYVSALIPAQQLVFLLPRGSAGRTPPVTQFDGHIGYSHPLGPKTRLEVYADLFNILNQQATLLVDDNYTYDMAAPIVNGTPDDLKYAKNLNGQPINKNPNFGRALAYQAPFHARLGLRLTF